MTQSQSQTQQTRGSIQFQLRLPDDLKARIESAANENGRSINTEIVVALLHRFPALPTNAKATADLLQYISGAGDDLEGSTRAAIVEGQLRSISSEISVARTDEGQVTITLNPKAPTE